MEKINSAIADESRKLIRRHERYLNNIESEVRRMGRRTGTVPTKKILRPSYWATDDGFNPYKVWSRRDGIAHAISAALRNRDYKPRPAVSYLVPKAGGGFRTVSVFQVADNAVSRTVFRQLMHKNGPRLSGSCYAYRSDLSAHDAILNIASELRRIGRVYVAEFDYSRFFDSIEHEHILRVMQDERFYVTQRERDIVTAFLQTPTVDRASYGAHPLPRSRGIPQGTSVSLFLANVAATPLDRALERVGVGFARYADDTIVWSRDYARLGSAIAILEDCGREMGVAINHDKSDGVSILCPSDARAEMAKKSAVEFVGYRITRGGVSMKKQAEKRIKQRIASIVYRNLIEGPRQGMVVPSRLGPSIDSDYVVMIMQVRRYLYGDLSEKSLLRHLSRETPRVRFRGLMSHYPVLSDAAFLVQMDGWLARTIKAAVAMRGKLISAIMPGIVLPRPHGLGTRDLINLRAAAGGVGGDLRLPSFVRMAKLMRKATIRFGANAVGNSLSDYGGARRGSDAGYGFL